jgi:hypothetical protein
MTFRLVKACGDKGQIRVETATVAGYAEILLEVG